MEAFLEKKFKAVKKHVTHSAAGTGAFAAEYIKGLKQGSVIGLSGNLGSGKTCFVQGAAAALGADRHDVVSPTFNIVKEYRGAPGGPVIYHFDLYRLSDDRELENIGYRDYFYAANSYIFIEWPENVEETGDDLTNAVFFRNTGPNSREITLYERKKTQQKKREKRQTKKRGRS